METSAAREIIHCQECSAGQLQRRYITYYTWLGDELITVPNFPAWICDVCGRREYDPQALNQLSLLLSPNAGKRAPQRPRPSRPDVAGDIPLATHPK